MASTSPSTLSLNGRALWRGTSRKHREPGCNGSETPGDATPRCSPFRVLMGRGKAQDEHLRALAHKAKGGAVEASALELAEILGVGSERAASRIVASLVEAGHITRVSGGGRGRKTLLRLAETLTRNPANPDLETRQTLTGNPDLPALRGVGGSAVQPSSLRSASLQVSAKESEASDEARASRAGNPDRETLTQNPDRMSGFVQTVRVVVEIPGLVEALAALTSRPAPSTEPPRLHPANADAPPSPRSDPASPHGKTLARFEAILRRLSGKSEHEIEAEVMQAHRRPEETVRRAAQTVLLKEQRGEPIEDFGRFVGWLFKHQKFDEHACCGWETFDEEHAERQRKRDAERAPPSAAPQKSLTFDDYFQQQVAEAKANVAKRAKAGT